MLKAENHIIKILLGTFLIGTLMIVMGFLLNDPASSNQIPQNGLVAISVSQPEAVVEATVAIPDFHSDWIFIDRSSITRNYSNFISEFYANEKVKISFKLNCFRYQSTKQCRMRFIEELLTCYSGKIDIPPFL